MIDFNIVNKALKVAWIPRLQSRSDASWKIIPEAALGNLGVISFLSQCNYDVKFLQFNNLPDFYSDLLKYWQNTRSAFHKNTCPHNEIIWNNHNIIIDGKALFVYKSWLEKKTFYGLKVSLTITVTSFLTIFSLKNFICKHSSLSISV